MSLRCVVVDDEPLAITIMEGFLKKIPYVELLRSFENAMPVFEFLKENQVDLIFLDIEMPGLTGIDFVKTLSQPPAIIFITANKNYAIEGFDLNVDDFILKPISFERLLKSVNRVHEKKSGVKDKAIAQDFLYLKENKKMVKVYLKNILYLESIKDYVRVVTNCKTVVTKQPLNYFESILSPSNFLRIHRSFIVAIHKIDAYSLSGIDIGDKELPIGRKYKEPVIEKLDQISKANSV
ncbi:MAG: LytTR family DNA-binding domain-containing protein [Bacteroidales bacterium]|jgi:DNA-binding LytR/AlgR family response regulator|nr:LytTR family DNA-binding domain-containing protein [Bacteroidales bacterium]